MFSDSILEVTEGTRVNAELALGYELEGARRRASILESVRVLHSNAMTWEDDRRVCAFVTARDPVVLRFAKNVIGWTDEAAFAGIDANLLGAIALHEAITSQGIRYVVDPTTPYIEYSGDSSLIDFLQFPRQTLEFGAGDCDDLSTLYTALLESVGIETSFLTIPDHLYMAFLLSASPEEARERYHRPEDLIIEDEKVWLPVEVTTRDAGFLRAWQEGAKRWREHSATGQAALYRTHDSWQVYEPVGFTESGAQIPLPERARVITRYRSEVERFIEQETFERVPELEELARTASDPAPHINRLGVLYAQFGLLAKARAQFERLASRDADDIRALLNLGNLAYLDGDWVAARNRFQRAAELSPDNTRVMVSLARAQYELEDYGSSRSLIRRVQAIDRHLAQRYSYLGLGAASGTRAGPGASHADVLWLSSAARVTDSVAAAG